MIKTTKSFRHLSSRNVLAKKIEYKDSVRKDLKGLGRTQALRLVATVERKLKQTPVSATPLSGEFQGLFRVRVGDFRAVYKETPRGFLVLRIAHRKEVYRRPL